ncbi:MAG: antiterminator LoaP [Spirochaetales bacterium]|nr:antiterminator LoaP [Spirochaetales bacterium]
MKYYVLQVQTGEEERVKKLIECVLGAQNLLSGGTLYLPRRELTIRRKGKTKKEELPIYPGYLFWECDEFNPDIYWAVRPIDGMYKFLKSNRNIEALSGDDLKLLMHFLQHGELVGTSTVSFDVNNRIIVKDGPLKGLEGRIIKVDKRKKRAKIRLDMYDDGFVVDFGFNILEPRKDEHA